ncbi:transposable element Tcb2 transposase [Trichonephila clavipes]|nr:transposable element Tcb2 transposase [Trichonephila clavipes]
MFLGDHTYLHLLQRVPQIGLRYQDAIFDRYVDPYTDIIGNKFILIDNNAPNHRAVLVEDYLENHVWKKMDWIAKFPVLNPIEDIETTLANSLLL